MTNEKTPQIIVFTDLDGTLLDAETYSYAQSQSALKRLQSAGIPVVFCSSKTDAEQVPIRKALNVTGPYILENGSAVVVPPGTVTPPYYDSETEDGTRYVLFGLPSGEIRARLATIGGELGLELRGFADMTDAEVAESTGLDLDAATLARQRDYSETVVTPFTREDRERFQRACEAHDLNAHDGGKYVTVTGAAADKGRAAKFVAHSYRMQYSDITTVGIGDSPNDTPLLLAVDHAYVVERPAGLHKQVYVPRIYRMQAVGPAGFAAMVDDILLP